MAGFFAGSGGIAGFLTSGSIISVQSALVFGVDIVAGVLTLAYVSKLLFKNSEHTLIEEKQGGGAAIKRSLQNQYICRRAR